VPRHRCLAARHIAVMASLVALLGDALPDLLPSPS
jgi:hypothetical protein